MFTGIIEELGVISKLELRPDSAQLTVRGAKVLEGTRVGDSIAVNGVCLTVIRLAGQEFTVDIMAETLAKTILAELKPGDRVNLERALQLQTRLGGHLVTGHVDGVGTIRRVTPYGIAHVYEIETPDPLLPYILPKGSVAIDGISLTVVEVKPHSFTVSLIPHTFAETTLGFKRTGHKVNLETDLLGKYVARFMAARQTAASPAPASLSLDFLAKHGFT